jgi:3-deoxy-D-manno-octulosonate 8-phosphate phosphatase (KDO 8-P phosphatase)
MSASTQCTDGLQALQAIAFDVDGVLTDGTILWGPNGEEWKRFSFPDIMGISLARRLGIRMALISGESSPLVDRYAEKMHIEHVVKGCRDKAAALRDFAAAIGIPLAGICFFGDDINDLSAMEIAGLCACPANANDAVLDHVSKHGFIAKHPGGCGAVRDLIDTILKVRNLDPKAVFQLRPQG